MEHIEKASLRVVLRIELEGANSLALELNVERLVRIAPMPELIALFLDVIAIVRPLHLKVIQPQLLIERIIENPRGRRLVESSLVVRASASDEGRGEEEGGEGLGAHDSASITQLRDLSHRRRQRSSSLPD